MSLRSHLDDPHSQIGQFLKQRFSQTTNITKDANRRLRNAATLFPTVPVSSFLSGLLGTAIDYRIRYSFDITPSQKLAAYKGACMLPYLIDGGHERPYTQELIDTFFSRLDATLQTIQPVRRRVEREAERVLARYCYVLALFEEVYRSTRYREGSLLVPAPKQSVEALLSIPEDFMIEDLCAMSELFYDKHNHLLLRPFILNPTFVGSGDVAGADADLIVDGCLIEIKSRKSPTLAPEALRQVTGYALLDYTDQYNIESIGIYMARQGELFAWPISDYLRLLTGDETATLPQLRQEFREVCQKEQQQKYKRTGETKELVGTRSYEEMVALLDSSDLVLYEDDTESFRIIRNARSQMRPYQIIWPKHPYYGGGYIGNYETLGQLLANEGLEEATDILSELEIVRRRRHGSPILP